MLVEAELLQDDAVEALGGEHERHLVDRLHVLGGDHRFLGHVAEERELGLQVLGQEAVGAAQEHTRRDPDRAQLADAVLHRLGLELVRGRDVGHERQVDEDRVVAARVLAELAHRLEERQALDVADRAADLDDHHVGVLVARSAGARDLADPGLDLVGDVRDHLDGAAEVVAAPLARDHRAVDLAGRDVRGFRGDAVREALVVPEVEVGLGAVLRDVDLAVLVGAHGAGVDVQVRVALHHRDPEAVPLEQRPDRGGGEALAERGDHAARHEDVLGQSLVPFSEASSARTRSRSSGVSTATPASPSTRQDADPHAVGECPQLLEALRLLERRWGERGEAQQRLPPVAVEPDVPAREPARHGGRRRGPGVGARALAHVGDRAAREIQRVTRRVGHHLDDRGRQHLVRRAERERERRDLDPGVAHERKGDGVDARRVEHRLVALHVDHDPGVERPRHLGHPVGAGGMPGRGQHGLAAEAAHRVRDARVVGRDQHPVDPFRRARAFVHPLDHALAVDFRERLPR